MKSRYSASAPTIDSFSTVAGSPPSVSYSLSRWMSYAVYAENSTIPTTVVTQ